MTTELRTERRGPTLILTISGPGTRNTLSRQFFAAAVEALDVAESDAGLRCVVVHGDGSHFCAGSDAVELRDRGAAAMAEIVPWAGRFDQFIETLRTLSKPVLAAVEGTASGCGMSLALACDQVVAAEGARFSPVQPGLAPFADGGGDWLLCNSLPRVQALHWLWLGEPIGARELLQHGLVSRVCANGEALTEACALAERLAQRAPEALAAAKELVGHATVDEDRARALARLRLRAFDTPAHGTHDDHGSPKRATR